MTPIEQSPTLGPAAVVLIDKASDWLPRLIEKIRAEIPGKVGIICSPENRDEARRLVAEAGLTDRVTCSSVTSDNEMGLLQWDPPQTLVTLPINLDKSAKERIRSVLNLRFTPNKYSFTDAASELPMRRFMGQRESLHWGVPDDAGARAGLVASHPGRTPFAPKVVVKPAAEDQRFAAS